MKRRGKISTRVFRNLMSFVLGALQPVADPCLRIFWRASSCRIDGPPSATLHFPPQDSDLRLLNAFRSPAQYRLIFEEFFWLECGLALKRAKARLQPGIAFELDRSRARTDQGDAAFQADGRAETRARRDREGDAGAASHEPLLQGDVGSGKTLVAAEAAVIAIENRYQVAVLAPTEILATQHYLYFKQSVPEARIRGRSAHRIEHRAREDAVEEAARVGLAQVAIGTHALLEEDVELQRLGLAIVDEQHRFGVLQRLKLFEKGRHPDVLVMTATPIPRTLALTIYGDLDVAVIDELPPGRKPIVTKHVTEDQVERVYSFLKQHVDLGRQAYIVYPVIEESETQAMKAAEKMYQHLSEIVYPGLPIGLLHGKLTPDTKETVMDRFKRGELSILVSTTVIEVGVDVPNATIMLIEQAERFGLSQLHQLRGRVGRGAEQSYCILVTGKLNDAGKERIRTMVESNDGFYIAEMDMKLRGPGEFFGTKQSGLPALRVANIIRDSDVLEIARCEAKQFTEHPPSEEELRRGVAYIRDHWQRRYGLIQVG